MTQAAKTPRVTPSSAHSINVLSIMSANPAARACSTEQGAIHRKVIRAVQQSAAMATNTSLTINVLPAQSAGPMTKVTMRAAKTPHVRRNCALPMKQFGATFVYRVRRALPTKPATTQAAKTPNVTPARLVLLITARTRVCPAMKDRFLDQDKRNAMSAPQGLTQRKTNAYPVQAIWFLKKAHHRVMWWRRPLCLAQETTAICIGQPTTGTNGVAI